MGWREGDGCRVVGSGSGEVGDECGGVGSCNEGWILIVEG